jgi:hypothetical protein
MSNFILIIFSLQSPPAFDTLIKPHLATPIKERIMTVEKDPPVARNIHKNCNLQGHDFQPRFSYGEVTNPIFTLSHRYVASELVRMNEALRSQTYIHDICTRCGKVVKAEEERTELSGI